MTDTPEEARLRHKYIESIEESLSTIEKNLKELYDNHTPGDNG